MTTKAPKIAGEILEVPTDSITPNPWNPNKQSDFMFEKERGSIREFGFLDPITVRTLDDGSLQIVDGEHRWRAALAEKMPAVQVLNLGNLTDARARVLTDLLNSIRGKVDPGRWADMITEALAVDEHLAALLPYSEAELSSLLEIANVDWDALGKKNPPPTDGALFKRLILSLTEQAHERAMDVFRRIKAARKLDSDEAAFEVLLDSFERHPIPRSTAKKGIVDAPDAT
jgi:ParB/RepB/Spo0J family partition protein